jgi:ketosteroid isomerase-like protein
MAEGKRAEEVEERIAKKDMVGDEKAISPVEGSSAFLESETALTAQKSVPQPSQLNHTNDQKDTHPLNEYDAPSDLKDKSISVAHLPTDPNSPIEAEEPIFQSKAPSLIATEEAVRQFFADYMERYTQKDIDGFLSLFSPQAVQNQRDGFDEITKMYSDFFDESQGLRYHIEGMRIDIYQNAVEAKGRYTADQILKKRGKKEIWRGEIRWILVRENGALRIRSLDFRPQESPG